MTTLKSYLTLLLAAVCWLEISAADFCLNRRLENSAQTVHAIVRDSSGLAWIGANKGLYVYDGCRVLEPKSGPDLENVQIYDIKITPDRIFMATDNGLYSQKSSGDDLRHYDNGLPPEIRAMAVADGSIWLCSVYGVWRYDMNLKNGIEIPAENGERIAAYSIIRDKHGIVYIGAFSGLFRYDEKTKKLIREDIPDDMASVESLAEDDEGNLWIGTSRGLFKMSAQRRDILLIPETRDISVRALAFNENNGEIYVGTNNGLLTIKDDYVRYKNIHLHNNPYSLADNSIWSLFADVEGNVWVGTEKGFSVFPESVGLHSLESRNILFDDNDECQITQILRDADSRILWAGSTNGLTRYELDNGNSTRISLSNSRIRYLYRMKSGKIGIATDNGLSIYSPADGNQQHIILRNASGSRSQTWVYGVQELGDTLWLGSYLGGIMGISTARLENSEGEIIADVEISGPERMGNNMVNQLAKDKNGNLWASLSHIDSILCISENGRKVTSVPLSMGDLRVEPWGFVVSGNKVWIADLWGMHAVDIDTHRIQHIKMPYCYANDKVQTLGAVGSEIWVSRASGLWGIDTVSMKVRLIKMPFRDISALSYDSKSGFVTLGIGNNIICINPKQLNNYKTAKISGVIIENEPDLGVNRIVGSRKTNDKIKVRNGESLTIGFMTENYSPFATPRFVWKEEKDSVWTLLPLQNPVIKLQNMSVGNHRILVKEANDEDSKTEISFTVCFLPPWYLSWWAIMIYVVILGLLVWSVVSYLNRKNRKHREDIERENALATVNEKLLFLSNISHDLKTPLSLIMGPICELRDSLNPENPAMGKLNLAYENARRLNSLVQRAVNLNRIDAEKDGFMIYSRINIVDFCKSVFDQYQRNYPLRHFVFTQSDDCIVADVDAVKLESILNNLISNSCKYSEEDSTISCNVEKIGDMVEISVSDDGFGIPKEEQSLVFQKMFRSKKTSSLREGTGLGLYLIKRYTEQHGGKITVESVEDQGTTFRVSLPLAKDSGDTAEIVETSVQKTNGKKVLIVEDNAQIAEYLEKLLSGRYVTAVASNGRAGLGVASSFSPDLIISDEMMPVMTGLEMCLQLRNNPRLASIPVILLTAKDDSVTENKGVEAGVRVIMHKPFDPSVLLAQVERLISLNDKLKESFRIQYLTEPHPIEELSTTERQLSTLARIIEENISNKNLNVSFLSEESGINSKQVYRLVTKYIGVTPSDYIRQMRLRKAALLLADGKFNVSEVMFMVGFSSSSYFSKCFSDAYGCTPSKYIEQQKDKNGSDGLDVL